MDISALLLNYGLNLFQPVPIDGFIIDSEFPVLFRHRFAYESLQVFLAIELILGRRIYYSSS